MKEKTANRNDGKLTTYSHKWTEKIEINVTIN